MSETLEGIVVDVSKMETTAPTREKSSAAGNSTAKHQFREVTKMIPHEEVTIAEIQQPLQPATDCHGFGNAAEMREALMEASIALSSATHHHLTEYDAKECLAVIESALAKPPRNCDRFATLDDARNAFFADYVPDETCSSATAFAIWIFDEVKGETDGSK